MQLLFIIILLVCGSGNEMGKFDIGMMLKLHNAEHKPAFVVDLALQEKAQDHAEWMAHYKLLSHAQLGCVDFAWTGENIAFGYKDEKSVMQGWMNSSGHRANILNKKFTHIGFGSATDNDGIRWWCVEFGGY